MSGFQYIPRTGSSVGFSGPTFYVPPQCSICNIPAKRLSCKSCFNHGKFYFSDKPKEPRSFEDICLEFRKNNAKLLLLHKQISEVKREVSENLKDLEIRHLEEEIRDLRLDVAVMEQSLREKKQLLSHRRTAMNKYVTVRNDTQMKRNSTNDALSRVKASIKDVVPRIGAVNRDIQSLRKRNIQKIFEKYLPIKSSSVVDGDTIAGIKIDFCSGSFTTPEPTISTHASLTLIIIALRSLTSILNFNFPVDTKHLFQLNIFDVTAPMRDNITRMYKVVDQLIQVIVEIISLQSRSVGTSKYIRDAYSSRLQPLRALYYLSQAFKYDKPQSWSFDAPYVLSSGDTFAKINYELAKYPSRMISKPPIRVQRPRERSPSPYHHRGYDDPSSPDYDEWDIVDEM